MNKIVKSTQNHSELCNTSLNKQFNQANYEM